MIINMSTLADREDERVLDGVLQERGSVARQLVPGLRDMFFSRSEFGSISRFTSPFESRIIIQPRWPSGILLPSSSGQDLRPRPAT